MFDVDELLDESASWAAQSRNPFLTHTIALARGLAQASLGDPVALATLRAAINDSQNRIQIGFQAGALSVALALLGHYQQAAELIGSHSNAKAAYHTLRRSPEVIAAWKTTRDALGDADYDAAVRRGAARNHEQLISWIITCLDELIPSAP